MSYSNAARVKVGAALVAASLAVVAVWFLTRGGSKTPGRRMTISDCRRVPPPKANGSRYLTLETQIREELAAGNFDRAGRHANEFLGMADETRGSWAYGNVIHVGNSALGRVALAHGDLVEARARLLASAEVDGSPQLDTFGPSMALAQGLLERGEIAVVLQYLERCKRFWRMRVWRDRDFLEAWETDVAANRIPDFGFHLCL